MCNVLFRFPVADGYTEISSQRYENSEVVNLFHTIFGD